MNEAQLNASDRAPQGGDAPALWDERDSLLAEAGGATHSETVLPSSGEAPASSFPAAPMRACAFSSRRSEGGLLAAAASLAAHALVIAGLLFYAPWDGRGSLQGEDEISVEIVDSLPQPTPSPEPAASTEQAQPAAPEAKASDTEPGPVPPPAVSETLPPPVPEAEANPPPAETSPPAVEPQTPPPTPVPTEAAPPPPEPPVRQTEPAKLVPPAADLAQRERAERLEREKREEAEKAVRERAARAAENAKRQEALRQEAQRQAAQRQEAERQAQAKAAEAAAANASAASAYRNSVIGHLASFKRYPPAARARGAQGSPAVSFSIDASGRVVSVSLTRASGDPDFDAEIVAMVHRASPFPAPPPGAPHVFSAGVNFRLQ
jgi:periplasmic protein TonB